MLLARVVRVLEAEGIPFALIGAAAMAAHGVSRSTEDTDLFAVGPRPLDEARFRSLAASGVDVDVRQGDDDDPLLGVVRFTDADQTIDLVVGRSRWQSDILTRAKIARVFAVDLPIVTVEDLVLLKLYAGGVQDGWDITQLLASTGAALDRVGIDTRVLDLPERSQSLWQRLRGEPS